MIFNFDIADVMSENAVCRPRALARQGGIRVDLCGCGQVHVAIGAITVRLASADYLTRCETLLAAARHMPSDRAAPLH